MKETEKQFEIPLDFSELVFKAINDILQPQHRDNYTYRVRRLKEILLPVADEKFKLDSKRETAEVFKNVDRDDYRNDIPYANGVNFRVASRIFPLLVAMCQRLEIISLKERKEKKAMNIE